ncbi:hypothetical protein RRU94_15495 [Domibacillus sp. DTU_2020_1001157_1_SI_ALB_TIR_016]|uniref:hypothetical protein n=1 Tax=Domibacillus sp. DTU_2020_1001157_1_SI_ALB_TIR_016 TaxID=3077789 RepID=UPI0028F0AE15|nr:hypothetical protein [Domibacillus sp. DTU_2020_1001157_1_SI_ALB_TIR_016]WNS82153.1 hypothetical protein RRU94_15495 [Domibacillus sp. DTU_2020_1001157_1_SI_ALB_TIR_016]
MNQKLQILGEGRKVLKKEIDEFGTDQTVSTIEYDDGTVVKITIANGDIDIECNKGLNMQPDGNTATIVG